MVNYNESHIYKICCRDTSIEDIYIGSTVNFRTRKYQHKSACNKLNNIKIYQFIRDNGGWDNWDMVLIEEVKVNSKLELHKKEREFIELLKPSLNIAIPTRTVKEYKEDNKETIKEKRKGKITCECGSVYGKRDKARHNKTKKHINYMN